MDSIKKSFGYGAQSGQEPMSGETGQGTADQPYDAGNVAGQSGAPASDSTSTNPSGTTQYDTGTRNDGQETGLNTSENLTPGVVNQDESLAAQNDAGESRYNATNEGAVSKGTDQGPGPDEAVAHTNRSGPAAGENTTAQETFFKNAHVNPSEKAAPSKFANEVSDKNPFESSKSSSGKDAVEATSKEDTAAPTSTITSSSAGHDQPSSTTGSGLEKVGSSAAEKGYKTADTEPHSESSEVLSSATPGAALGSSDGSSEPTSRSQGASYDQPSTTTGSSGYDEPSTATGRSGHIDSTPAVAAVDTDYPSPKTQPTESQGGLSGIDHNTGSAPSAPETGNKAAMEDPGLGASVGQGGGEKKKMGDRIKEKLHIGGKKDS
ncbi:MAG: hypothetical protein Q9174_000230 [Haloplaca sp. 1 TL-2023]